MTSLQQTTCPACLNANGISCQKYATSSDSEGFECQACGKFEISRTAMSTQFHKDSTAITKMQRAALAHRIADNTRRKNKVFITSDWIKHFLTDARLPSPAIQAINLIKIIGDYVYETGEAYFIDDPVDCVRTGCFNLQLFSKLCDELRENGLIQSIARITMPNSRSNGVIQGQTTSLTLAGWERYEAEKSGKISGKYGFVALKFHEDTLDEFILDHVKPTVKSEIAHDVLDMRDLSTAGIIDNIMREKIRESAFVLADLSHDNLGAYWEAGYAEGLGKPVIYLCEKEKFEKFNTHFDTNHSTTILWSIKTATESTEQLIATLRRTLNLFPGSG